MLLRPRHAGFGKPKTAGNPQQKEYKEKGVIDSGCSRHMTGNKCYLTEYEDYDGGFVSFGDGKGRISGKGKIKIGTLDFDNGIKREFNVARTPQQNGVAERKNRTLIEAARTMVLVIKPHNKTPYELIRGRTPLIDFIKPFGCPVTILNTRDHLGKFDGKVDEGFFVGYSMVSKAIRVFNKRTRIVKEPLNIRFLENTHNVTGNGPDWLFDVDSLTISMNYVPVVIGTRDNIVTGQAKKKTEPEQEYILIPFCTTDTLISQGPKDSEEDSRMKPTEVDSVHPNRTNSINTISTLVSTARPYDDLSSPFNAVKTFEEHLFEQFSPFKNAFTLTDVPNEFSIDNTRTFGNAYDDEDVGADADLNNLETTMNVSHIPITRIDKDHPKHQIIGDFNSATQTRRMTKISDEHSMYKVIQALEDPSWIEAMQEELLQFQLQKVWTLVDLPNGKRDIGTKWVFRNKKDEKGIVVRNKARLMDVKSAFLYGNIEEETANTPIETNKALVKEEETEAVDVHLYRSMIGSLMYLIASRPDIRFAICASARFQVTPKTSHIHAVKRIFRYLKGQPKLGLWYPRDLPFDLDAFSDSDYDGASLDRKSTIGGYQFLRRRLISWQCKKQTIVANSTTETEYVAAANCCGQSSGPIHLVADKTVYKEWEERMERATTTASSLETEKESGNINRTQSIATLNEPSP
ncbi:putative ribonuclease H-like domain-containing protein [Tanacetum coccineum]